MSEELYRSVGERLDWARPELTALAECYRAGETEPAVLGFIGHLRGRETPWMGYTKAYVEQLRAAATGSERQGAGQRWETAASGDLLMPYHRNAFAALGAETVILAATPERCRRLAARVIEERDRWGTGYWGVTHSVCDLLRFLWPLVECADVDLVPLFGWLLAKSDVEWRQARAWNETTLGTSGHNWWAHTFYGFWMMGMFFPEFKGFGQYRALGEDYLEREVNILFDEDGWSKEGSPGYHDFAAENLIQWAHLAEENGMVIPDRVRQRLRTIAHAGWRLLAPDGDYPVFGDHVRAARYAGFHAHGRPDLGTTTVLRRRAARFSLPEAKFVAEALDPGWQPPFAGLLPDDGEDLLPTYRRLASVPPAAVDSALPHSGIFVMRQDWTPRADYAAIMAGPLGPRITSHKHADIFSFELYSRGRRILVDNWYGSVAEERKDDRVRMWRVGTAAHNTATVDGEDQVPIVAEFLFGATVLPTIDDWQSEAAYSYFSGVHEGYYRLRERVTGVRRKLFYLRGGYWILIDRFTAATQAEHAYQLHFHLNIPATLQQDGRVVTRGEGGNLLIAPVPGANGEAALEPNPYPIEGYENPAHLCYTRRTKGHDLFVTLLVPFEGDQMPEVKTELMPVEADERVLPAWEATGLEIHLRGQRHVYVDQHMHWNLPWRCGGLTGEGRLFHSAVG